MVKQESSTPGVYLVGPSGGKMRPWCGKCHKFLKSETAPHDCTPSLVKGSHRPSSSGGKRRRIRLTDKTRALLSKVFEAAALGEGCLRIMDKLRKYSKNKQVSGSKIAKLVTSPATKSSIKRAASLKKRFL